MTPQGRASRRAKAYVRQGKQLSEAHIQATCSDWLSLDGWRCVRTDMPHLRGLGVSELGMADHQFIRYMCGSNAMLTDRDDVRRADSQTLWVEFKKRGGKAEQHQKDWHARERARGGLVWVLGEDFPASIEGFAEHYAKSGLQRKKMSLPR